MPLGKSGVLRTFFCGLGRKVAPKASFRFITLRSFNRTGFNAFAHGTAKKWQKIK
ncbi:MAG: hypothetical protein ACKO96_09340 [Flammeovirgaceae bacterium]